MKIKGGQTLQRVDNNDLWTNPTSKYRIIFDMRNTSPMIRGLLNAVKDPIKTAIWKINPNGAKKEIADYVNENFFIRTNFFEFLNYALYFLDYGYMAFEKEWIVDKGKYYLKLHPRMPFSIVFWTYDYKKGTVVSATQMTTSGTVDIPMKNLFLLINDRQTLNPEGQSILRPLYRAYVLSEEVEVATADGLKKNAMGIPIAQYPDNIDPDDEKKVENFLKGIYSSPNAYFMEKGDIHFRFQGVEGRTANPEPFLNKLNSDVFNSQSAGIFTLSTANRGSRAVGTTLAPPFYNRIASIASAMSYAINDLIKEMVDLNFKTDVYPKIMASGISAKDIVEKAYAIAAVKDFLQGVDITQYLLDGFEIPITVKEAKK